MTDGDEITRLIHLYAFGIDARRLDLFDSIFTTDVVADYGFDAWTNLEAWKRDFEVLHASLDATQHTISNVSWTIEGDTASALSYGVSHLVRRGIPGGDIRVGGCWYADDLIRTAGRWRIRRRTCRLIWESGNPAVIELSAGKADVEYVSLADASATGGIGYLNSAGPSR